jgi:hypothetical protein
MDQLEVCLLLAQTCFLSVGLYLLNTGHDSTATPPTGAGDITIADVIMLATMVNQEEETLPILLNLFLFSPSVPPFAFIKKKKKKL